MTDTDTIRSLEQRALAIRKHVVTVAQSQFAHVGGSMSCADLLAALFFHWLREGRDHFLLSKGHAVHALHGCLAEQGKIDLAELPLTMQSGSRLAGHPSLKTPGVELATGSLGHALSVGIGIALAEQLDGSEARTVVLLGDGELQEGTIWEAALSAPRFGCERLLAIVDYNKIQAAGAVDDVLTLEPLVDKWKAFGWNVDEIDGHDMEAIVAALQRLPAARGPTAIIAHTVKGKGVPDIEGTPAAHFTMLTPEQAQAAIEALEGRS